jgi:hypothetical protein
MNRAQAQAEIFQLFLGFERLPAEHLPNEELPGIK